MSGKVYLVGAGPGDYKLLTLKGKECLEKAEVIVYDRLVNEDYLKCAPSNCEKIYVGKAASNHTLTQDEINQVLAKKALENKTVVRLKGGDPYVFGRGGEEAIYLLERNIPFEVVPGITSAIGGLCYAGIPITHRDVAASFHVITGHLKDGENTSINWDALVKMEGTLVFLMGLSSLDTICNNLKQAGMLPDMPVAVINWATTPQQKVVTGTLTTIYQEVKTAKLTSPCIIVVGKVVDLRAELNFFETKPLFGKTVVTTRARAQNSSLKAKLLDQGAHVLEFPTIKIKEIEENKALGQAIRNLTQYTYVIFTSQNAVDIFFKHLGDRGLDTRALASLKLVAIGSATYDKLKEYGICADYMPKRYVAESIVETIGEHLGPDDYVLIPRALKARTYLKEALSSFCKVEEISIYDTIPEDEGHEVIVKALENKQVDYITFTSSSTAENLVQLLGTEKIPMINDAKLISIGEITSKTMKQLGLNVYCEAEVFTIEGVIKAILEDALHNKGVYKND